MDRKIFLLNELARCVADMEDEMVAEVANTYLQEGFNAHEGIMQGGCGNGKAGELFEQGEYFVPELLICSDAMNVGLSILRPRWYQKIWRKISI